MQHQKQDVLALAKRKQMRPQRHLARKIKSSLRRSRQRPRKLPFPARPNKSRRRPAPPSQTPRRPPPSPHGEDRARVFVRPDTPPTPTSHPPPTRLPSKPNRQWDRVAPASSFQPLQKPQPA